METKPLTDFQPLVSFDPYEVGIPLAGSKALMATEWLVANSCKGHFDYPACLLWAQIPAQVTHLPGKMETPDLGNLSWLNVEGWMRGVGKVLLQLKACTAHLEDPSLDPTSGSSQPHLTPTPNNLDPHFAPVNTYARIHLSQPTSLYI